MDGRRRLSNPSGTHQPTPGHDPTDTPAPAIPEPGAADDVLADAARRRLRRHGIVPIEPDRRIGVLLSEDEELVTVRRAVTVDRRQPCPDLPPGVDGDLYVTTRRLVHLGRRRITFELDDIREAVVASDRLFLVLADGQGVAISVDDPRHLRVEISAARAARIESRARSAGLALEPEPAGGAEPEGDPQRSRR